MNRRLRHQQRNAYNKAINRIVDIRNQHWQSGSSGRKMGRGRVHVNPISLAVFVPCVCCITEGSLFSSYLVSSYSRAPWMVMVNIMEMRCLLFQPMTCMDELVVFVRVVMCAGVQLLARVVSSIEVNPTSTDLTSPFPLPHPNQRVAFLIFARRTGPG